MRVKGRTLITGLPYAIEVSSSEMLEALDECVEQIVVTAHVVLEKTPPELAADISDRGIDVYKRQGLTIAAKEHGINLATTAVGDRYVLEEMKNSGYNLGGEQSGPVSYTHLEVYKRQT